jgi:hypothetical protein
MALHWPARAWPTARSCDLRAPSGRPPARCAGCSTASSRWSVRSTSSRIARSRNCCSRRHRPSWSGSSVVSIHSSAPQELVARVAVLVVHPQRVGLRVRVRRRRCRWRVRPVCRRSTRSPWGRHVLHEVGDLAHHRAPAGFVPADRAVGERHLQLAVVVHAGLQLVGQPRLDRRSRAPACCASSGTSRRRSARRSRRSATSSPSAPCASPVLAAALLVEVHAHDQRLAERLRHLDELLPRRVHAQDVADDDLALVLRARSTISCASATVSASGFSTNRCEPPRSAVRAIAAWVSG